MAACDLLGQARHTGCCGCGRDGQRGWVVPGAAPSRGVRGVKAVVIHDGLVTDRVGAVEHAATREQEIARGA